MTTFDKALAALGLDPLVTDANAQQNALRIARFAEAISDELFSALGFTDSSTTTPAAYKVAWYDEGGGSDQGPPDGLLLLQLGRLYHILPGTEAPECDDFIAQYTLDFCPGRVECRQVETHEGAYDGSNLNPDVPKGWNATMTYDQAAVFVIAHLAKQVLTVLQFRPNEARDKVITIYDRLAVLLQPAE